MSVSITVFVVDPDEASRLRIQSIASEMGLPSEAFATGEALLAAYKKGSPGCVVTEFRLPGMSGLELQEAMAEHEATPTLLFITQSTETQLTVRAVRNGATTVLEKSVGRKRLRNAIDRAVAHCQDNHHVATAYRQIHARFAALPPRERGILPFVLAAMSARKIARQLELSHRAVKSARRNIFKRTRTESLAELAQLSHVACFGEEHGAHSGLPFANDACTVLRSTMLELRRLIDRTSQEFVTRQLGELAHELNQPLSVITNASAVIAHADQQEKRLDRPKLCELNEMIMTAAKLAKEILDRSSTMQVDPKGQRQELRLDELVRESIGMLQFTAQAKQVDVQCDLHEVRASVDQVEMQQVVINLLKNAMDAAAENQIGSRHVTLTLRSTASSAEIIVSDNGPGLGEMSADKMFETSVSSKDQGRGFGLSISKRIVESHGGRLWFQPIKPRGASFHVSLPRSD